MLHAPVHGTLWRDLLYLGRYSQLVRDFDPDVVHVQHQDLATIGGLLARRTGCPFVLTTHGQVRERLWFPFGQVPRIVAVSEDVRQSLVTQGQVPRELIDVVPDGVATNLSALDEERDEKDIPVVGTVNRIARDRGIDVFLRSARAVLDRGLEAYFLVIGEGPAEREVRKLAVDLKLTPHLTFALPRSRVADLFRPMSIFVSASQSEGHGIFLLSAMAEARPVIATGVGGVLSFLNDGENGLVVPRGDVDSIAEQIARLLENPDEARRLGREGFRYVREHYPLHRMVEQTQAAYDKALGHAPLHASARA
jgi:glycosyltransferase involved in cell wall biosynthesis